MGRLVMPRLFARSVLAWSADVLHTVADALGAASRIV